jgi:hypothetical protein
MLLILAFPIAGYDIMHVAAQKDLQRTTIYCADAHEMFLRRALAPALGELERRAEALLQPVQAKPLALVGKAPRRKIGRRQR